MTSRAVRRVVLAAAATTFLSFLNPNKADACSCMGAGAPCNAFAGSTVVFTGRVTRLVSELQQDRSSGPYTAHAVEFDVEGPVSGIGVGRVIIDNGPGAYGDGPACGLDFVVGEHYVVYADAYEAGDRPSGRLFTSSCTRTRLLSDPMTRADLAYFEWRRQPARKGAIVSGVVIDVSWDLSLRPSPPQPLADIPITVVPFSGAGPMTTKTRADGSYEIRGVPPGRLRIDASLPGEFHAEQRVGVMRLDELRTPLDVKECVEVNILARLDSRIRGQVLDENGRPVARQLVEVADAEAARVLDRAKLPVAIGRTDGNGSFDLRYLKSGRYIVGVNLTAFWRPGILDRRRYYDGTRDGSAASVITLDTAEQRDIGPFRLASLPANRIVTVVVHAPTQQALAGTMVYLTESNHERVAQTTIPLELKVPYGTSYWIEAVAAPGYRILEPAKVRVGGYDMDRTVEFRVER